MNKPGDRRRLQFGTSCRCAAIHSNRLAGVSFVCLFVFKKLFISPRPHFHFACLCGRAARDPSGVPTRSVAGAAGPRPRAQEPAGRSGLQQETGTEGACRGQSRLRLRAEAEPRRAQELEQSSAPPLPGHCLFRRPLRCPVNPVAPLAEKEPRTPRPGGHGKWGHACAQHPRPASATSDPRRELLCSCTG